LDQQISLKLKTMTQ